VTISLLHESKEYIKRDRIHPITLKCNTDNNFFLLGLIPPFIMLDFLQNIDVKRPKSKTVGFYRPILFPNDFWLIKKDAYLLNNTAGYSKKRRKATN
jgi:hypothetical protein